MNYFREKNFKLFFERSRTHTHIYTCSVRGTHRINSGKSGNNNSGSCSQLGTAYKVVPFSRPVLVGMAIGRSRRRRRHRRWLIRRGSCALPRESLYGRETWSGAPADMTFRPPPSNPTTHVASFKRKCHVFLTAPRPYATISTTPTRFQFFIRKVWNYLPSSFDLFVGTNLHSSCPAIVSELIFSLCQARI